MAQHLLEEYLGLSHTVTSSRGQNQWLKAIDSGRQFSPSARPLFAERGSEGGARTHLNTDLPQNDKLWN